MLFAPSVFDTVVYYNSSEQLTSLTGKATSMKLNGLLHAIGMPDDMDGFAGSAISAIR